MKCPLCGFNFNEDEARAACQGCPLSGSCGMVRCPNCNYDVPRQSRLLAAFKALRRKDNGTKRKG